LSTHTLGEYLFERLQYRIRYHQTRMLACNLPSINNDTTWDHFRRHPKHLSIKKQKQYVKKQARRL